MKLATVLFDCDGVLVDSEPIAAAVASQAFAEIGWHISAAEARARFTGMTLRDMLPLITEEIGGPVPPEWVAGLPRRLMRAMTEQALVMEGAAEMLHATNALGLHWRVASNSSRPELAVKFSRTGLADLVGDRYHSAAEVARGKPAPDIFLHAAAAAETPPGACLVVEDSVPGVRAARAAGMCCIGFAPTLDGADLAAEGAILVRGMAELPRIFAHAMAHGTEGLPADLLSMSRA